MVAIWLDQVSPFVPAKLTSDKGASSIEVTRRNEFWEFSGLTASLYVNFYDIQWISYDYPNSSTSISRPEVCRHVVEVLLIPFGM